MRSEQQRFAKQPNISCSTDGCEVYRGNHWASWSPRLCLALARELPGYATYMSETPSRLVPRVW